MVRLVVASPAALSSIRACSSNASMRWDFQSMVFPSGKQPLALSYQLSAWSCKFGHVNLRFFFLLGRIHLRPFLMKKVINSFLHAVIRLVADRVKQRSVVAVNFQCVFVFGTGQALHESLPETEFA